MAKTHAIDRLFATIASRKGGDPSKSYTAALLKEGPAKCAKKFGEEAVEAALAGVLKDKKALAAESADVLYHLLVLWAVNGITPDDVYAALAAREGQSGIAEKASRAKKR
ncbi:MAG TPA: phosphoribosyl-ATP diphosphatase [Rhizomicrobium sp.]|jgi:phosphoribosyl-ATP pyrophosphohydrolase|nr:phosphoribosyl-ATP diphosphatase [Rhizomicrobium sp.]